MKRISLILILAAQLVSHYSHAADTDLSADSSSPQTVGGGDNLTVNEGVELSISASVSATAVTLSGNSANVTNDGAIAVNVDGADAQGQAVSSAYNSNQITNNGSITINSTNAEASSGLDFGIISALTLSRKTGSDASYITNNGSITLSSDADARTGTSPSYNYNFVYGFQAVANPSAYTTYLTNNGNLNINSSAGIRAIYSEADAVVINKGTINIAKTGPEGWVSGIWMKQTGNQFTNSGDINITNAGDAPTYGAIALGETNPGSTAVLVGKNTIDNSGAIIISAPKAQVAGLVTNGNDNSITNRGDIILTGLDLTSDNRRAISFTGQHNDIEDNTNNTLNFYTQSTVTGAILFGSSASGNMFNIIDGGLDREYVISYEGNSDVNIGSTLLAIHNSSAGKIATFNKTEHSYSSAATNELNNIIQNIAFSKNKNIDRVCKKSIDNCDSGSWVEVFNSKQNRPAISRKSLMKNDITVSGVVAGYQVRDEELDANISFFAGGMYSKHNFSGSQIKIGGKGVFAGLSLNKPIHTNTTLDLALTAGYTQKDRDRLVYNTLTVDGYEKLTSKANSVYVSPAIKLTHLFKINSNWSLIPSLSLNYVNEMIGEYKETDSGYNSSQVVKSRLIGTMNSRMQLGLEKKSTRHNRNYINMYVGLSRRDIIHGDDIIIEAIGKTATFNVSKNIYQTRGLVGMQFSRLINPSASMELSFEASKGLKHSSLKNNWGSNISLGIQFSL